MAFCLEFQKFSRSLKQFWKQNTIFAVCMVCRCQHYVWFIFEKYFSVFWSLDYKRGTPVWNIYPTEMGVSYSFEIESWNIQQKLNLGFYESPQNFSSFKQLFFIVSKDPRKTTQKLMYNFSAFFLWKLLKKCCLNELKFCEVSDILKSSICWKFQPSISRTVGYPHFCGVNISNS